MVKRAKELGMPAIAITDHGNMYGVYKFYKAAKKAGIKPILGCEFYVVDDMMSRNHKEHKGHLVLLAKNNAGYINLCKLNSAAWTRGFYSKPRVDYDLIAKHSKGLVCLSGCLGGHIPHYLMKNMYDEAKKYAVNLKKIFKDDFYIELQDFGAAENDLTNPLMIQMAKELNIELAATNDVHYIYREDADMQDALMCVEMKKTVDDPDRMRFPAEEFYVKTYDEMYKLFGESAPSALTNTLKIAEKCDCHPFERQDFIPTFINPEGIDNTTYFRELVENGLIERYGKIDGQVKKRLEHEFNMINDNGFVDYFLIVADIMRFANEKGIAVGPGRGSGVGSIIAYALNITKLDPFKYDLLFERFLHNERITMPDFDLDFCCNRRDEIIQYVKDKYGEKMVCQIVTFGSLAAKAAIKDIARVFKMPYAEVDKITKPMQFSQVMKPPFLPYVFDMEKIADPRKKKDFATLDEKEQESLTDAFVKEKAKLDELRNNDLIALYNENPEVKKIVDMAMKVEGFPRNCSTHACGVIICKDTVGDLTPLQKNGEDITSQFDMKEMEELGFLKMDFLGLITLTDIQMTLEAIGKKIDFYKMKYDDPEVYKMLGEGDTDAVFQMETGGFKKFLQQLKPDCIEDIIAAVSLYRPGPMDMIPAYCRNKHNPKLTKYDHPMLESILGNTYGQIVYQEQVMDIFRVMGGYNLGQADMVRRAMGKKDLKEMAKQKEIFIYGCKKSNISGALKKDVKKEIAVKLFDKMAKFAGYAFNKSHGAGYAYIAYQTAYLKKYYYPYYMASVLNNRVNKWEDMTFYITSTRNAGTQVLPPDINKSSTFFTVDNDAIRFGLGALKGVGTALIENILAEREKNGDFKSFQDFCRRVDSQAHNKRVLESLILSGAFDEFARRSQLMGVYPQIVKLLSNEKKVIDAGQMSFFGMAGIAEKEKDIPLPNTPDFDNATKLRFEKEFVGIYLSGHPLEQAPSFGFDTRFIKRKATTEEVEIEDDSNEFGDDSKIAMVAIISKVKRVKTKAGNKDMAIVSIEDLYGSCELMLFPAIYDKFKLLLVEDTIVKITGRLSIREGEDAIILVDTIDSLNQGGSPTAPTAIKNIEKKLYIKYNMSDIALHGDVMNVLEAYRGKVPVWVRNTATGLMTPLEKVGVRDCKAVVYELASHVGTDNVVFK